MPLNPRCRASVLNRYSRIPKFASEIFSFRPFLRRFETAAQHDLNYLYGAVKCGWATRTIISEAWEAIYKSSREHAARYQVRNKAGKRGKQSPTTRIGSPKPGMGAFAARTFAVNNNNNKGNKPIIPSWKTAAIICNYVNKTLLVEIIWLP